MRCKVSTVLFGLSLAAIAATLVAERTGVLSAQAQAPSDEEKKKKEHEKKGPPPKGQPPPKGPPPKGPPPPPPKGPPPPPKGPPPLPPKGPPPPPPPKGPPEFKKELPKEPPPSKGVPEFKKEWPKGPPASPKDSTLPGGPPSGLPKGPIGQPPPGKGPLPEKGPAAVAPPGPVSPRSIDKASVPGPKRFEEVQKGRQRHVEEGGKRTVIQEPGNRVIVKEGNRAVIRHDEAERFQRRPDARSERRADGITVTFYTRPDGVRVFTEVDASGRLVRRYRRERDGREHNLIDNRRFLRNAAIGVGIGAIALGVALNLPPPRVTIPRERYIVEYERASDEDLDEALEAEPIERLERGYSLDEIRYNYELRARLRRIDLNSVTFEFGAWEVGPEQYPRLERIARAILRVLRHRPDDVFLVEGHTDAVGSDEDNLSLSDRRASAVAEILSDTFGVPPENLVTQGYGEQYLKVDTQGPEPRNRRVSVVNITRALAER